MYNVLDVSRYVINYSNKKEYGISNLKLQKVLYFIQASFVISSVTKRKCFSEVIEAWDFGPVVPEAYHEFKQFGSSNIPSIDSYIMFNHDNIWMSESVIFDEKVIEPSDKKIIEAVVDKLANYSATDLVGITHKQLPWKDAYVPSMNKEITVESIGKYFSE